MRTLLLMAAAVLVAAGCQEQLENPRTLNPSQPTVDDLRSRELQRDQLTDVPVPLGFEFVDRSNTSWSYTKGGVRVAELHYWGTKPVSEVIEFYRQTMSQPPFGWTPAETATGTLAFRKEGLSCLLDIHNGRQGTVIDIRVTGAAAGR